MKWMNRLAITALCAGLMPLAGAADAADRTAEEPHELAYQGVDGNVNSLEDQPLNWVVVANVPESDHSAASNATDAKADSATDESMDVGDTDTLYAEDLFNDKAVAKKGLADEAGWDVQVADNGNSAEPYNR